MGVRSNVDGFTSSMQRRAAAIPGAEQAAVRAAGAAAKSAVIAAARGRGVKPQASWVSVTYAGSAGHSTALVELRGSRAYWAERGTKAHSLKPRNKKAIVTPFGPRASARVRGVKARPFWKTGTVQARPAIAKAHSDVLIAALRGRG